MNWNRASKYAEKSECGRYSICAIGFEGSAGGFFEVWQTRQHKDGSHLVATNLRTAADGRQIAEEYDASLDG